MNFKSDFHKLLLSGASHEQLLIAVVQFKTQGGLQREAYDQLHELWLELGFDEDESNEENQKRDELEYMMELVWGFCSSDQALWESSLSSQS